MVEFDTLYYYAMDREDDSSRPLGEIPTISIMNIVVKDMVESKEAGHAFILDVGSKIFHLNTPHRFELEKWVQAIEISIQTAKERKLSITGKCKNISKVVTLFDTNEDILREQILSQFEAELPQNKTSSWEDVDELLHYCSKLKEDMITVSKR